MANIDRWFLRIAVIYALVAMFLGITMGIREDFTQAPTHAHLNLVGWVSMALYALVYRQYPAAALFKPSRRTGRASSIRRSPRNGWPAKMTGNGFLVEFSGMADAQRCPTSM
jgi:hypothetical protein